MRILIIPRTNVIVEQKFILVDLVVSLPGLDGVFGIYPDSHFCGVDVGNSIESLNPWRVPANMLFFPRLAHKIMEGALIATSDWRRR
jgi:hypothetical protein